MATFVHRRDTSEGPRYRVWNTIVDQYETAELTRDACADYLLTRSLTHPVHVAERLTRADARGTSSRLDERDMAGPWDQEVCRECNRYHHVFESREAGVRCRLCGEPHADAGHSTPCAPGGG